MDANAIHLIPYAQNPLASFASQFISDNQDSLPDLTQHVILLANPAAAPALRRELLNVAKSFACNALLGPKITVLSQWITDFYPHELQICTEAAQKLLLVDAVRNYPHITGDVNPWAYVEDLGNLLGELSQMNVQLPDDVETFISNIEQAYEIPASCKNSIRPYYSKEATLVYDLWKAWHEQLTSNKKIDAHNAYALGLKNSLEFISSTTKSKEPFLHVVGYKTFSEIELEWLKTLLQTKKAKYYPSGELQNNITSGQSFNSQSKALLQYNWPLIKQLSKLDCEYENSTTTNETDFYHHVYCENTEQEILADAYHEWNNKTHCEVFLAHNLDEEARAIDIQVRLWLLDNKRHIGIITENRTLARRVRALLDRSGINIQDQAGWALSTTRLAGLLENWLQCIEEDFNYLSYLDILKSPDCFPEIEAATQQDIAYRFEHDLIEDEKILCDISAYRKASIDRCARLKDEFSADNSGLLEIFNLTEQAARPLQACSRDKKHSAETLLQALSASMEKLGLSQAFSEDAAGIELLNTLSLLGADQQATQVKLDWSEFRLWLASHIESARFYPPDTQHAVTLMGLSQAQLQQFDALIIAGLENDILPGPSQTQTFFNDAVKYELGLKTSVDVKNEKFYHFRNLLDSSPTLLLSARKSQHGDPISISPWLELLQTAFSRLNKNHQACDIMAYVKDIRNHLTDTGYTGVTVNTRQPKPIAPYNLLPETISASAYQQLINCPYQFFAERCLKLKPTDEIKLQLSKADFGQRVHRCLEALHKDIPGLPGPFTRTINEDSRDAISKLLTEIGKQVFANDLTTNYEHQAWLQQWHLIIPKFVNWLITHSTTWQLDAPESYQELSIELLNKKQISLKGIIDRIDKHTDGYAITDYKTGATASNKNVFNGESIQLPFYALIANKETILQVSYLALQRDDVTVKAKIQDDDLMMLMQAEYERIQEIFNELYSQAPLPAWGDEQTCSHCDVEGLCRKQSWQELIAG